ncbi:ABC transporter ATP-binding protein [Maritalea sp.]|uniref:ABC transporter ATP-binding protein n=1 Tax=Maritalea sp. TaxID=2003361 RepID=UPI003EF15697
MAGLQLRNVTKNFGALNVIKGIDLDISHGEFVVFVGPSGCGKSTLLRMIAGLEEISDGDLFIDDIFCNDMAPRDRGIAMVFQSYALYPHMTVYDNIGFSLKMAGLSKSERDAKIREAASILQMEELLERKPAQLSGGQRQRVAIGRSIVRDPKAFLFDEPLSNLDAALRVDMRMEIATLHQNLDATMIYVTHDQIEAMTLADKIVVLDQGVVQQVGRPLDLYQRPENLFVAGFIGAPKMNLFPISVTAVEGDQISVGSEDVKPNKFDISGHDLSVGADLVLGIRPHQLALARAEEGLIRGDVILVEHLGNETVINISTASGNSVLATIAGVADVRPGESIGLNFTPDDTHIFLASGPSIKSAAAATI